MNKLLRTRSFGTPFRNITRLNSLGISVRLAHLPLADMQPYLTAGVPIIVLISTEDLAYWSQAVDHVVVVIGLDDTHVYVNDPALPTGEKAVPLPEFELAQLRFDHLCALLTIEK